MAKCPARKRKAPKRVLALPDLEHAKSAVLTSLTSASGKRTYDHAITEFVGCLLNAGDDGPARPSTSFPTGSRAVARPCARGRPCQPDPQ